MDSFDLQIFIKVAEERSMSKAGQQLMISQSSVSSRVANMEGELHARLFERNKTGAFLTEAGRRFYYYAIYALSAIEAGKKTLKETTSDRQEDLFRMGLTRSLTRLAMPSIVRVMRSLNRPMQWKINTGQSWEMMILTMTGDIHAAIINQVPRMISGLNANVLLEVPIKFIASSSEKVLNNLQTYMERAPFILLKRGMTSRELIEQDLFNQLNMRPKQMIEVDNNQMIMELVRHGAGYSFLPLFSLIEQDKTIEKGIQIVELPEVKMTQRICYIYRQPVDEWYRGVIEHLYIDIKNELDKDQNILLNA